MLKLKKYLYYYILMSIFPVSQLSGECDGFNWYHNINPDHCDSGDLEILHQFINNSGDSLAMDMDIDFNGKVDVLELGWQLWEDGRLIHWICQEVPSPYYFYEYNCGLSGKIPNKIGSLDALVKLRLQTNNLSGKIPKSICDLAIINDGSYWFNLENNKLCPPYPKCVDGLLGSQRLTNCK